MATIEDRISELSKKVQDMEAGNTAAKDLAKKDGTKYEPAHSPSIIYKIKRDIDALTLFKFLEAGTRTKNNPEMAKLLKRFVEPESGTTIEVNKDDKITDLLIKYKDTKDIAAKLQAACTKKGLLLDYTNNVIASGKGV